MAIEVVVPPFGESIASATIVSWLRGVGEEVRMGDTLAELETDKATTELECPASGVVLAELANEGEVVEVGRLLAVIGKRGESWIPKEEQGEEMSAVRAAPSARRLAKDLNVDLSEIAKSVGERRITATDVQRFHDEATSHGSSAGQGRIVRLSRIRATVADRMAESASTIPQFSVSATIDATQLVSVRNPSISLTAYFLWALCTAIDKCPTLNARYLGGGKIELFALKNVALAVATAEGIVAPVMRDAGGLTLEELDSGSKELAGAARAGTLAPETMNGATFTLSNLGSLGAERLVPMVVPGQAAILGVGALRNKVVPGDDETVSVRPMMDVTLVADHRITDGAGVMEFIDRFRDALETRIQEAR